MRENMGSKNRIITVPKSIEIEPYSPIRVVWLFSYHFSGKEEPQ